ncbi:MAG: MATE family efflux transporter [Candidatus Sumerlaeota bacterium]|nr:MATE family efflux transporter [Candidatus Sumerlaeota bacterium]
MSSPPNANSNSHPKVHGRDLTTGSIPRHLIMFSLPMLAGSAIQTAYSFVNAIWVGQFLGKTAMAAVTVSFPVIFVLVALAAGLTMATNILISQYTGSRNFDERFKVVQSSTLLIGVLGLVLFALGEIFTPHIMRAMDTPPEVLEMATQYMRIFLISLPFGFGIFLARSMLQGIGDSTTPLYYQTAGIVANAVLDPILMFGWLGLPKLGLNGTAWASVIGQAGSLIALLVHMQRQKSPVSPDWLRLRADYRTTWNTIKIGVPSAIQQSLVSIGMVFVIGFVNGYGVNAAAAFGAAMRIDQLAFMPALTFSMAVSTLAGQNIGANQYGRVKDVFKWGIILSGGITLLASALAVSVPGLLLRIFIQDREVISMGVSYLYIVGSTYIFFAIMFISNGIINGSGHTVVTTVISLVSLWVVRVPLAYRLSHSYHDVRTIWYSMSFSFFVAMVISLAYYYSGYWKRPVVRRGPITPAPESVFGEESGEI